MQWKAPGLLKRSKFAPVSQVCPLRNLQTKSGGCSSCPCSAEAALRKSSHHRRLKEAAWHIEAVALPGLPKFWCVTCTRVFCHIVKCLGFDWGCTQNFKKSSKMSILRRVSLSHQSITLKSIETCLSQRKKSHRRRVGTSSGEVFPPQRLHFYPVSGLYPAGCTSGTSSQEP